MATYVISDIHGEYEQFLSLLAQINLQPDDSLYILGDVLDRGPEPIRTLIHLMGMKNVIPIAGNHELMALDCLRFLRKEITEKSIRELTPEVTENFFTWAENGSAPTIEEFRKLQSERQQAVIDYIREFSVCEEIIVNGQKYLLVHAGLGNYSPDKEIDDYSLKELMWDRADYETMYFPDTYVITGHTPTQLIDDNPNPGYIYRKNNHIAIDCGACFPGGRLAAICLDNGYEYYSR
ncbi:MAG: serine/threonine protein phosphatase [Lachnospiraceae bacterium]|nr:serine/threonine protein phosphatase [Lachnospiraceae bacterium]